MFTCVNADSGQKEEHEGTAEYMVQGQGGMFRRGVEKTKQYCHKQATTIQDQTRKAVVGYGKGW